jgi:protease IV
MDRNRKILIAILVVLLVSVLMAIIDVGMRIQKDANKEISVLIPKSGPGIGIVRIEGPIGFSDRGTSFGMTSGVEHINKRLDEFSRNSNIKAIIVRINSPGGSVAATQEIYEKLWRLRKQNIPLIASMGDIAASGGYYVASACNVIVANHGTITGSIGVIAASPNLKGLFDKLGIKMNVIKSGRYKDIFSSHREVTREETALLQRMINSTYRKFLRDVALGRSRNQSDIEPYADGRIMIGEEALEHKLIDVIGTFEDAIDRAREIAKLDGDSPIYDDVMTPLERFLLSLEGFFDGYKKITGSSGANPGYRLEYRYVP